MAYIEVQHSYKRYQMGSTTITANDDVSFGIEKGELAIILGASARASRRCSTFWVAWTRIQKAAWSSTDATFPTIPRNS